MKYKKKI